VRAARSDLQGAQYRNTQLALRFYESQLSNVVIERTGSSNTYQISTKGDSIGSVTGVDGVDKLVGCGVDDHH
jgi:hypothetical protein